MLWCLHWKRGWGDGHLTFGVRVGWGDGRCLEWSKVEWGLKFGVSVGSGGIMKCVLQSTYHKLVHHYYHHSPFQSRI